MKLFLLLVVVVAVCVSLSDCRLFSNYPVVSFRGGAKGGKGSVGHAEASNGSRKGVKRGKGRSEGRRRSRAKWSKSTSFKARLEKLAKQGQFVYKDVYRRAKVLRSSAFEAMLLKATWPSNDPVQPDILGEIIKYSIPAFKYSDADGEDDPYYMTLHKLWTKMSEADWRTVAKSLYILHTIARDSQPDACVKFSTAIKDMVKTRNPKNPEHRYFSVNAIAELDEASAPFEGYVTAYANYVIHRTKHFTARFEELKGLNTNSTAVKVVATLKKAQQTITLGLAAEVTDKKQANAITGYATKQVANDLRDLYILFGEKIKPFVAQSGKYTNQQAVGSEEILQLLKFYQQAGAQIKSYLERNAKLYSRLRIKIPTDLDSKALPSAAAVSQRIRDLSSPAAGASSLSGGSTALPPHTSTSSTSQSRNEAATKRTLQRADRPLTPDEVRWNVELSGRHSAYAAVVRPSASCQGATMSTTDRVAAPLSSTLQKSTGGARATETGGDDSAADHSDDDLCEDGACESTAGCCDDEDCGQDDADDEENGEEEGEEDEEDDESTYPDDVKHDSRGKAAAEEDGGAEGEEEGTEEGADSAQEKDIEDGEDAEEDDHGEDDDQDEGEDDHDDDGLEEDEDEEAEEGEEEDDADLEDDSEDRGEGNDDEGEDEDDEDEDDDE